MLERLLIGVVRGAIAEVLPQHVLPQMAEKLVLAHRTPAAKPLPSTAMPSIDVGSVADQVIERVLANPALQTATEAKPWYASTGVWGGLIAAAAPLFGLLGITVDADMQNQLTAAVVGIASAAGGIMAIVGRAKASRPVTMTKPRG